MSDKRKSILRKVTDSETLTPSKQVTIDDNPASGLRRSSRVVKQNIKYINDSLDDSIGSSKKKSPKRVLLTKKNDTETSTDDYETSGTESSKNEDTENENMECENMSLDDDDDTNDDNAQIKVSNLLLDDNVSGKKLYGFQTPKKRGSMVQKATEIVNSPSFNTPSRKNNNKINTKTPRSVRSKMKKEISSLIRENDSDFSASESDYQPSDSSSSAELSENDENSSDASDDQQIVKPKLTQRLMGNNRTTRNKKDLSYKMNTDEYFASHSTNKILTSNHTLQKLKNPKLSEDQLIELLNDVNLNVSHTHEECIKDLCNQSCNEFHKWMSILNEGFSVLVYGLGSKRNILGQFQKELLNAKFPVIVVNGYFPSLTIKDVLDGIIVDLLEHSDSPSNVYDSLEIIENSFARMHVQLYLIVHNIDGEMLRNNKSQNILAQLAAIPNIHLVASIDHINTPLIWDHSKLSKYNFTWWDGTSFLPYTDETSFESSLLVQKSGALVLSSISSVYQSLTKNSKGIFMLIVKYQLSKKDEKHYQGIPFKVLYTQCRENFLVSSDLALRAQLTEFLDHKLVKSKRSGDGTELLLIPINNSILQHFSEEINNENN